MTVTAVEALELSQILGSLLGSIVEAQAESARATVSFVEDVGFESVDGEERMRSVTLRYSKKDEAGEQADFEVEVPLLTLVNVPSLAISGAKLDFSYDVVSAASGPEATPTSAMPTLRPGVAKLTGFVRARQPGAKASATQRTTSIDLEVSLTQQELPLGVERLFDLAELGISERQLPPPK